MPPKGWKFTKCKKCGFLNLTKVPNWMILKKCEICEMIIEVNPKKQGDKI